MKDIVITTAFGLEALSKRQIKDRGIPITKVEDGKITVSGNEETVARLNIHLGTADRVYLVLGRFKVLSFEDLFQGTLAIDFENLMPADANFNINGKSKASKIYSVRDSQKIIEKAVVRAMQRRYALSYFPKTGKDFKIRFEINRDICTLMLDTSGQGLHKRGYREEGGLAPLRETLARAIVELSFIAPDRPFADLFCGSGTIAIEAARYLRKIAPGIERDFDARHFSEKYRRAFEKVRQEALAEIDYDVPVDILASDIDGGIVSQAIRNAEAAGVREDIRFITRDFRQVALKDNYGVLVTNPPYGHRLSDREKVRELMRDLRDKLEKLTTWSSYIITAEQDLEKMLGRQADRRRKLYNGTIETQLYQFYGPKPPRKEKKA